MLNRGSANLAESSQKLEEIERQLRARLEKAKEVASSCCNLDEPNLKTQEELLSEIEVKSYPHSRYKCPSSTLQSTITTPTGKSTWKMSSTSP
jgi:hypothetical protein